MKKLLVVSLLSLLAGSASAADEAVSAGAASGWRQALAAELNDPAARDRWARRYAEEKRGRPAVSEEEVLRWDFTEDSRALTMTLSRKAFERHAEHYRRWQNDPELRIKYKDNSSAYLGAMNGRTAAAMIDAIVTPLHGTAVVESLPLTGRLIDFLVETMRLAERVDSGEFDLFGTDVDDFFRDRFRDSSHARVALRPSASSTRRRLRVRVKPRTDLASSKVAVVYSADPGYALLKGGRVDLGVELVPFKSAEIVRGWVGVTRPWPDR